MSACRVRGCGGDAVAVWDVGPLVLGDEASAPRWAVCRAHIRELEDGDAWDCDGEELLMGDDT